MFGSWFKYTNHEQFFRWLVKQSMNWVGISCYEGACQLVRCDHGIINILGKGRSLLVGDSHWSTYKGNETLSGICLKYSNDVLRHSVMSDSLWPHGLQPTRLLCPWDYPARILEWVAISSSRGSSWPRDWNHIYSWILNSWQILYHWATFPMTPPTKIWGKG